MSTTKQPQQSQHYDLDYLKMVNKETIQLLKDHQQEDYIKSFYSHVCPAKNPATGNIYKGLNAIYLNRLTDIHAYEFNHYLPHGKISETGGMVKKGQKSHRAFNEIQTKYYNTKAEDITKDIEAKLAAKESIDIDYRKESKALSYAVFNVGQTHGVSEKYLVQERDNWASHQEVRDKTDELIKILQLKIGHPKKKTEIGYTKATDTIHIASPESYQTQYEYLDDLFPLITKAMNHPDRLNREVSSLKESKDFLSAELANEMAASALAHQLGYYLTITKNDELIDEWQRLLERDPYFLRNSSGRMKQTLEYISDKQKTKQITLKEQVTPEQKQKVLKQDQKKKSQRKSPTKKIENGR